MDAPVNSPNHEQAADGFAQSVLQALWHRWPAAQWCEVHVALAVSGGSDSMALLRAVLALKQQQGGAGRVFVLHVNHHLRGDASDQDQAWLEDQCDGLGVELAVLHADLAQLAENQSQGIEAAARQVRYQLLAEAAENLGARFLVTGHTQDDQVETVLFRALRGSGLRGLRGIPGSRPLGESLTLVRPLLGCRREELVELLNSLQQAFRTDGSNQDTRHTRNRLRHDLLPLLRAEYNQEVDDALLRLSQQAEEADRCLEHLADTLLAQCTGPAQPAVLAFELGPLQHPPAYLVCEMLRLAWRRAGWPEQAMTYDWWQKLALMACGDRRQTVLNLPGGVRATLEGTQLLLVVCHS